MDDVLMIHCDGGARGNPGPGACAFVAEYGGKIVFKQSKFLGKTTNNAAEYAGVILALTWLKEIASNYQPSRIILFLDSELVVKQLRGLFKIKNENLRSLFYTIKSLEREIENEITYQNVSREKNKLADFLVNRELDKQK